MVQIIHDWDFPLMKKKSCFKTAMWLLGFTIFGKFKWFRKKMPQSLLEEKVSCMRMYMLLDKMFGVKSIWGVTQEVLEVFPFVLNELQSAGYEVRFHYHDKTVTSGKGRWVPPMQVSPKNMVYDRKYTLHGKRELPNKDEAVVWHIDHPYNLPWYVEFLERCKKEGLL